MPQPLPAPIRTGWSGRRAIAGQLAQAPPGERLAQLIAGSWPRDDDLDVLVNESGGDGTPNGGPSAGGGGGGGGGGGVRQPLGVEAWIISSVSSCRDQRSDGRDPKSAPTTTP